MNESDEPQSPPPSDKDGLSALVEEILAERESQLTAELPVEKPEVASEFLFDLPDETVVEETDEPVNVDTETQPETEDGVVDAAPPADAATSVASAPKASRSRTKKVLVSTGALVAAYGALVLIVGNEIPSGTRVGLTNVGRLSIEDARAALAPVGIDFEKRNVTILVAGNKTDGAVGDFGITYDVDATIAQIPTGSLNPMDLLSAVFSGKQVQPVIVESSALKSSLEELADAVNHPAVETTISLKSGEPVIVPGATGKVLDIDAARARILEEIRANPTADSWRLKLTLTPDDPKVTPAAAQQVIDDVVTPALSADVTVTTTSEEGVSSAIFTPKQIAKAMRFTVKDGVLRTHLDPRTVRNLTDPKFSGVETPVQNATWNVGSGVPVVVPSKPGFGVTDRALAAAIESVYTKPEGQRSAEVEFGVIKPTFSTTAAEKAGVTELLYSYTQRFPYAPYRVINIGKAAEYINGTYLAPGAEYSMNNTIKERTYENGYTDGWIIGGGGVFKMEPGGGVSTATTATFNAAFFSGMEFLEWRAHSIWIPDRYVPGREATVFWGSLDMRFRNPNKTGVFITTYMTKTSITVKFWGTKEWDKIDSIIGEKRNISQGRTIENNQPDCHEQDAVIGFRITVDRVFYKDDVEVKREPFNSSYRAAPAVICTYKAKPTKKPTPKPTKTTKKPTVTPSPSVTPTATTTP